MKRTSIPILTLAALALGCVAGLAGQDECWLDMENCGFCKNLAAEPGLLENLGWEHHAIEHGMVSVTTFKTGDAETAYDRARAGMEEAGKRMVAGEQVPMCPFCQSLTAIHMTGKAEFEEFPFDGGRIMLVTSADPEVVAMIKKHAQRTIDELAAMEGTQH